jgi:RNA polymerase sigma-70 factor (ECF subfamily)
MSALVLRPVFAVAPLAARAVARRVGGARSAAKAQAPLSPRDARRFRELMLPHLDAAYGFARALTRDPVAAEDLVQDAYLAAYRAFGGFRGGQPKAWLFAIVRSTFLMDVRRRGPDLAPAHDGFDVADPADGPESQLLRRGDDAAVRAAIDALPDPFREALVLRELNEMSYREIAEITAAPIGTVMSRLARARALLAAALGLEARP